MASAIFPEPQTSVEWQAVGLYLPLVSREWKNDSNSSYNCTPFLHSLLTKGKYRAFSSFACIFMGLDGPCGVYAGVNMGGLGA